MESNEEMNEESLDSVPQPAYEPIEDGEVYNEIDQTMEPEDKEFNEYIEDEENIEKYDASDDEDDDENDDNDDDDDDGNEEEHYETYNDMEKEIKETSPSLTAQRIHNGSSNIDSHEKERTVDDFSLEYEEDEEMSGEYAQRESQSFVNQLTSDKKNDPLIVQGNDGMIKKIKINNTTKDLNERSQSKLRKQLSNSVQNEVSHKLSQPRSSTPMSREYLALQRSVNESKILTEFVTDVANEKPRKLRAKDSANSVTSTTTDHSYSTVTVRKTSQLSPEKLNLDDANNIISPSQGKRQHKRFVPLKEGDYDVETSTNLRPRSRSKSMHNSELNATTTGSHKKLKKWPSEERIHKRTNMRSENSEFAQKQIEFLQRVIHANENPRSRSRSRSRSDGRSKSCGRRTPNSINEPNFAGSTVVGGMGAMVQQQQQQQKSHKSSSKERNSKRNKYEMGSENDEQQMLSLIENVNEQPDDVSINESQTSLMGSNTLVDTTIGDTDEIVEYLKSIWQPPPKPGYDSFCWKCHETKVNLCCCKCIRSFHATCIKMNKFDNIWLCPECTLIENLISNPKRSRRNELSLDLLSQLLSFALKRMRYTKGHYNFVMPYEDASIYNKYIVNPVTLTELQTKIETKEFRCAEEFVNETKWMLHNAYILSISNRNNHKLVLAAKSIFKICRQEANEIETCPECYLNANTRTDWFVDVCSQPHLLLWAKLKGFPYWPAKAMGLGPNSLINVRFFGEHDRAFVPLKDCYLLSEQDPNTATGKRAARELADCIKEVEEHIEKIRSKVGGFKYAPFKTPYDPAEEMKQLTEMMPGVEDFIKKQQGMTIKPSLQFKIYKTADNNLSIVQKASSTPELPSSNHDNDNDKEKEKKKKSSTSENNESKKLEESITTSPAKYEVVSKVSSDDSNSSKLSTVILKRKSVNGDSKKTNEEEAIELPLPKMTKIEDPPMEEEANKLNIKRKLETQTVEKSKAKHTKLEPKIPIMTIKTSLAKETSNNNSTTEVNSKISCEINTLSSKSLTQKQQTDNDDSTSLTQKVVENLVKHKQGVTIKKISKEAGSTNSPEQLQLLNKSKETPKENPNKNKKDEDEKAKENQKVNNILKGLIPFVEVKKEVVSDNEEETEKTQNEENRPKETSSSSSVTQNSNNNNKDNLNKTEEKTVNDSQTDNITKTLSNSLENPLEKEESNVLLTKVKEEVLTDEEEANVNPAFYNNTTTIITKLNTAATNSNSNEKLTSSNNTPGDIRVVGDTTIQKLTNKNNQSQICVASSSNNNNNSGCATNISSSGSTKRSSLKGVPYGPLPASAFPKSLTQKSFQQTDLNLQPRAKKSFPQHSPPVEKLKASSNLNVPTQMTSLQPTQHLEQKRTMSKNTMVAIPVDVATNRASTSTGAIVIGSIPIPPLTAVSKTVPTTVAHNSTARNSPATITVSGTSGSLTTPSILAQAKISTNTTIPATSASIISNSPITVTSSSLLAPLSSTLSLPSTPVSSSILNPITMTTPPPLAGLSNSSLINNPQTNGIINETNINTSISAATTPSTQTQQQQQPSTDTHLLGGLVTPTLASAITDVICRGPPKLAARPTGPLQSEGHPMFPSQAGPVCKRLVENVHKLTDFFISVVEDTMGEMAQGDDASLQAKVTLLTMELERTKQAYEQEIAELKRTSDLMLCEMRKSMENEKTRLAIEIRKQCEMERLRSVEETKRKQWCANCFREANFYCCWNTSYCDYPCQQLHWSRHSHTCAQTRTPINETTNSTATNITQPERHHSSKTSTSTITLNSSSNFNKPANVNQKKEKGTSKNTTNHMMSSIATSTANSASRSNTEVLKLPTNTYLRPVTTTNLNNQNMRCNTTYSLPVQRFNAPLPITTPANNGSQQTYTFVQQGNSWVMSNSNSLNSGNNSATNASTITAPISNITQVGVQQRSPGTGMNHIISHKSGKTQIRYH
ncbi:zinc finger MYND-type containing 8 isoform 1-T5 [Cochliomyia hominivorax]